MVARVIPVDDFDLVIFGATGDLARRKILPGLYRRFWAGQMPPGARIIGAARTDQDTEAFRATVRAAIEEFVPPTSAMPKRWRRSLTACPTCRWTRWAPMAGRP